MRVRHGDQIGIWRCWFLSRKTGEPGEAPPSLPTTPPLPEQTAGKLTTEAFHICHSVTLVAGERFCNCVIPVDLIL